mmetsp:Transcript_21131/g.35616  ORF Transcript_21131/g.35616 Transcript_21131/m.35616 type:complete len:216 (+) Transcript_21131:427-1074(+)
MASPFSNVVLRSASSVSAPQRSPTSPQFPKAAISPLHPQAALPTTLNEDNKHSFFDPLSSCSTPWRLRLIFMKRDGKKSSSSTLSPTAQSKSWVYSQGFQQAIQSSAPSPPSVSYFHTHSPPIEPERAFLARNTPPWPSFSEKCSRATFSSRSAPAAASSGPGTSSNTSLDSSSAGSDQAGPTIDSISLRQKRRILPVPSRKEPGKPMALTAKEL